MQIAAKVKGNNNNLGLKRSLSGCTKPKAGLRLSTYTTKLANWPITDAPDDIVVSLSGSFQLDFVVYDAPDGFRWLLTLLYPIQKMNRIRRQLTV